MYRREVVRLLDGHRWNTHGVTKDMVRKFVLSLQGGKHSKTGIYCSVQEQLDISIKVRSRNNFLLTPEARQQFRAEIEAMERVIHADGLEPSYLAHE